MGNVIFGNPVKFASPLPRALRVGEGRRRRSVHHFMHFGWHHLELRSLPSFWHQEVEEGLSGKPRGDRQRIQTTLSQQSCAARKIASKEEEEEMMSKESLLHLPQKGRDAAVQMEK